MRCSSRSPRRRCGPSSRPGPPRRRTRGLAAVIAMVAVSEGARDRVEETFEAMGTNLLIVVPGSAASDGMFGGADTKPTLTGTTSR